jgi:hypothetical protein
MPEPMLHRQLAGLGSLSLSDRPVERPRTVEASRWRLLQIHLTAQQGAKRLVYVEVVETANNRHSYTPFDCGR